MLRFTVPYYSTVINQIYMVLPTTRFIRPAGILRSNRGPKSMHEPYKPRTKEYQESHALLSSMKTACACMTVSYIQVLLISNITGGRFNNISYISLRTSKSSLKCHHCVLGTNVQSACMPSYNHFPKSVHNARCLDEWLGNEYGFFFFASSDSQGGSNPHARTTISPCVAPRGRHGRRNPNPSPLLPLRCRRMSVAEP
jgi:hypothetical protein